MSRAGNVNNNVSEQSWQGLFFGRNNGIVKISQTRTVSGVGISITSPDETTVLSCHGLLTEAQKPQNTVQTACVAVSARLGYRYLIGETVRLINI